MSHNKPTYFAAWRIEDHRDREMTFLGIFSSEALAEEAIKGHSATGPRNSHFPNGWPRWEYTIQPCSVDSSYIG